MGRSQPHHFEQRLRTSRRQFCGLLSVYGEEVNEKNDDGSFVVRRDVLVVESKCKSRGRAGGLEAWLRTRLIGSLRF
jgi:hypothetical protein